MSVRDNIIYINVDTAALMNLYSSDGRVESMLGCGYLVREPVSDGWSTYSRSS